jgi:hypothetical protein
MNYLFLLALLLSLVSAIEYCKISGHKKCWGMQGCGSYFDSKIEMVRVCAKVSPFLLNFACEQSAFSEDDLPRC